MDGDGGVRALYHKIQGGTTYVHLDPRVLPPNGMKAGGHIVVNEVGLVTRIT